MVKNNLINKMMQNNILLIAKDWKIKCILQMLNYNVKILLIQRF